MEESLAIFREIGDRRAYALALGLAGLIHRWQGAYDVAARSFAESLAIWQELSDEAQIITTAYDWMGMTLFRQGEAERGRALLEQGVAAWRATGDRAGEGMVLHNLACAEHALGDYAAARTCFENSLEIARELDYRVGIGEALAGLGDLALDCNDLDAAGRYLADAMPIHHDLGNRREIAHVLECFAGLAALQDQPERAVRLAAVAASLRETIGEPIPPDQAVRLERRLGRARQAGDEGALARAWAEGKAISVAEAIAMALGAPDA